MADFIANAQEAVSRVWDAENRSVRPDATADELRKAEEAVSRVDDEFMRDMLGQMVTEARAQWGSGRYIAPDEPVISHDEEPLRAVEAVFDFRERCLKENVTERQMQAAIAAVDGMDRNDPDYDMLVVAVGMAEREYRALANQEEKVKHSTEDAVDSMSLKDINRRLAEGGFEDSEIEPESVGTFIDVDDSDMEELLDDDFFFGFDFDDEDDEKEKKKKEQAEKNAKAKANAEKSRREYAEFEKKRQQELRDREYAEQMQKDADIARAQSEATGAYTAPDYASRYENPEYGTQDYGRTDAPSASGYGQSSGYDADKEAQRQAMERQRYEQEARLADENRLRQEEQHRREEHTRDWENAKHGENLHAANIEHRTEGQGLDSRKQDYDYGRQDYCMPSYEQADHPQKGYGASVYGTDYGKNYREASHQQTTPTQGHSYGQPSGITHEQEGRGTQDAALYGQDTGQKSGYEAYSYGNGSGTDSFYEQQKKQGMEDDRQAMKAEQQAANQQKIDEMAQEAMDRRASAEAFTEERHSSMKHRDEGIRKQERELQSAYENKTDYGSQYKTQYGTQYGPENRNQYGSQGGDSSQQRQRTPHHYNSQNYRPQGQVIGGGKDYDGSITPKDAILGAVGGLGESVCSTLSKDDGTMDSYSSYMREDREPRGKHIPVHPEDLTNKSYGSGYSNTVKDRYGATPAGRGRGPNGSPSIGTVIGRGTDISEPGNVKVLNSRDMAGKVFGGTTAVTGAAASAIGLVTNDETKVIQSGVLMAGTTIGVAGAGATALISGAWQKHQEVAAKRAAGMTVVPERTEHSSLSPGFGMRETAFDPVTGKKVRIDEIKGGISNRFNSAAESAIGQGEQQAWKNPKERRVGMMYSQVTHTRFINAVKEPLGVTLKTGGKIILNTDAFRNTEAGQGAYYATKGVRYAKGAVGATYLAGSIVQSAGYTAANVGRIGRAGLNYWTGSDVIGSTAVKQGMHLIPVRTVTAKKAWDAFGQNHKDLVSAFTRDVTVPSWQKIGGGQKNVLSSFRNKNGDMVYRILDVNALKAEISAMEAKIGMLSTADAKRLEELRDMLAKGQGQITGAIRGPKIKKAVRSVANVAHMYAMFLAGSDNAGAKSVNLMITSGRFVKAGLKVQLKTIQLGLHTKAGKYATRRARQGASALGDAAGRAGAAAGRGAVSLADRGIAKVAGIDYNRFRRVKSEYIKGIKNSLTNGLHGGIHNRVSASIAKAGRKIGGTTVGRGLTTVTRKTGKVFGAAKKAKDKVVGAAKTVGKVAMKPVTFILNYVVNPIQWLTGWIKTIVLIIVACFALFIFVFTLAGTALMSSQLMFTTDSANLQRYIDYAVDISEEWFAGTLKDSKVTIGGRKTSLNEVYEKGGSDTGKYRIITTKYVDEDGNEIDSNDNIKEILSMVAVKTFNTWPEDWQIIDNPFDGDDWTVKSVQDIIKYLYAASHTWEAVEKGPYAYYKEVNNKSQRLLVNPAYPGTGITYKKLKGDGEGEACKGPRSFKCTEESYDQYASEYRREMDASYGPRGGCTLDYSGYGTYDAAEDTLTLDGSLHDGTKVIYNAHEQVWATTDMKTRWSESQENGGEGDEKRKKHSRSYYSPAWGCWDYDEHFQHEARSTDRPAYGCDYYELELPDYTSVCQFPDTFPSTVTWVWNSTAQEYQFTYGGTTYKLNGYESYPYNSITFYYMNELCGYSSGYGYDLYIPEGTVFCCKDTYYDCNEWEYYCTGHRERVNIYYCPGHEEYYCDKNHYDLDINIHISHFDDDELFLNDKENTYTYKRKAKDISPYPEGFDKNKETAKDDFYWDEENIEIANNYAATDWNEIYDNLEGVDDVTMELDTETIKKYMEYLDVAKIASWENGIPKDANGVEITMRGNVEWFYDQTKGKYIKIKREFDYGFWTYTVIESSATSPVQLSELRKRIANNALSAVGKIPYVDGGAPGTGKTLADFGWVDDDQTQGIRKGLSSGGFVAWVYQRSGLNITNTDDIKKIWDKSTLIGDRNSITDDDLKPGDLGFINSYDDRLNEEVAQTEEDLLPFNTVGIYLGTNEQGQRIWIQCSKTNGVVSVTTSNAFNYFKRVNGVS